MLSNGVSAYFIITLGLLNVLEVASTIATYIDSIFMLSTLMLEQELRKHISYLWYVSGCLNSYLCRNCRTAKLSSFLSPELLRFFVRVSMYVYNYIQHILLLFYTGSFVLLTPSKLLWPVLSISI